MEIDINHQRRRRDGKLAEKEATVESVHLLIAVSDVAGPISGKLHLHKLRTPRAPSKYLPHPSLFLFIRFLDLKIKKKKHRVCKKSFSTPQRERKRENTWEEFFLPFVTTQAEEREGED